MAELTEGKFDASMESFAKIVKEGFDAVDQRFDAVDKRFDAVDQRFDVVEHVMKSQFKDVKEEIRLVNERIDGLSTQVDGFSKMHADLLLEITAMRDLYHRLTKTHNDLAVHSGFPQYRLAT